MQSSRVPQLETCPICGHVLVRTVVDGQYVLTCRACGEVVR